MRITSGVVVGISRLAKPEVKLSRKARQGIDKLNRTVIE